MQGQPSPKRRVPPEGRESGCDAPALRQEAAARIERDFRSLLDHLCLCQSAAEPAAGLKIEKLKAVVERGIGLSMKLRGVTDLEP